MSEISIFGWLVIANIVMWLASVVLAGKGKTLDNLSTFIGCLATVLSGFLFLWYMFG